MLTTIRLFGKINAIMLFAVLITVSLFYTMQLLIMTNEAIPEIGSPRKIQAITMPDWEPEPNRRTPMPEEVELPPEIPADNVIQIIDGPPTVSGWDKPVDDILIEIDDGYFLGPMDGNAMPIAQIQPRYPDNAAQRGIEGFVIVEFDVSETGLVMNPRVLGADPARIFDRAALRAIARWKYNPKIVDGRAVKMSNLRTRFSFDLRE